MSQNVTEGGRTREKLTSGLFLFASTTIPRGTSTEKSVLEIPSSLKICDCILTAMLEISGIRGIFFVSIQTSSLISALAPSQSVAISYRPTGRSSIAPEALAFRP